MFGYNSVCLLVSWKVKNQTNDDRWKVIDAVMDTVYWQDVSAFAASLARRLGTNGSQGHSDCSESRI
jgi:hypothetical protein